MQLCGVCVAAVAAVVVGVAVCGSGRIAGQPSTALTKLNAQCTLRTALVLTTQHPMRRPLSYPPITQYTGLCSYPDAVTRAVI